MVSEVEPSYSKKWRIGYNVFKPNGLGFIRASSALGPQSALKPACGDGGKAPIPRPTPVATQPKKKAAYTEGGRKYIIKLRCTEEEKAKIKAIARSCEMDVSELLRELINKHLAGIKIPTLRPVRLKRQFGRLYKAYKELNRIGVNINQIARGINIMAKGGRYHESFPEILYEIMSISNRLDVILDVVLEEDEN